ncbi:tyrosine-type recombinase/integrase [Cytobacillus gottheilii]|uniref:tyrosine-type recombinase/integrase n=1 Tax=Cytobacillus gottheilii TaxID=859144 RepID=UPI000A407076|nr:tyrosine-type recombinase/integrase [Cytobacillus gottheilii]
MTNIINLFSQKQIEEGRTPGTVKTYVGVLEKFQAWLTARDTELNHISKNDVQLFMDHLEEQKKGAGTIEKYFAAISVFARFLGKSEIMLNIHRKEKLKESDIPDSLEDKEEKKILSEVELDGNLRNTAIVYTLLYTGIRISELCALDLNDIDLTENKLFVKNEDGQIERGIPLSSEVNKHLRNYVDSINNPNREALFVSSVNKRLSTRAVQYMLQKYNVNPHKLRHTFCQKLINKGIDIHTVAKLAGHKDINVTKRYASVLEANLEDAINRAFS